MSSSTLPSRILLALVLVSVVAVSGCGGAQARKAKHMEKGQAYFTAGNFEKARVEFQNALQITPTDGDARFQLGLVDEKLGNPREAAQLYQGAIDANPDHVRARTNLARLYLFSGVPERALELIKPALEKHPDEAEALAVRAAAKIQQKDIAGARADAERAVQLAPTSENAVAVLAGIYSSNGEEAKARVLLEDGIKKIPGSVDLRLVLAQIYAGDNRLADSEALLVDLVRLKPDEKAHRIRLAQYYARIDQPDAAERVLREGMKALPAERDLKLALIQFLTARRSPEAAEKELQSMIGAEPKDNELKFALAKFYDDIKQPAKAEAVLLGVISSEKLEPAGLTARDRLAALRVRRNDLDGARQLTNEVLAKNPRDNDALILRGNLSLARKDPKSAIADLRAVLRDQPNALGVLRVLARAHLENGEPAIAEETIRRAVEANPKDMALRMDLAQLLVQLGKNDQAKPLLAEIVKQQPDNVTALDAQFRVAAAAKDLVTAKAAAAGIIATKPKAALGYFFQGMIAEAEQHDDEAMRLYSTAVDMQPEVVEPLQAQMRILVRSKRTPEALKRLDEFSKRYPTNGLGAHIKGELLLSIGRNVEAQEAFRTAIARAPKWWAPYRGLAYAQAGAKDSSGALETLQRGESMAEQTDVLGIEHAAYLERLGRLDESVKQYESVISKHPQSDVAANNLAMLLVTHKNDPASLDRAKALSARFAESTNPSFLDTYGWVLLKRGETAAALPVLERVVAKAPNAPVALYHLGMAQSKAGNEAQARENLTRAVKSGVNFSGVDEAKATLEKLATASPPETASPKS
jgi:tetratricopeptide (TPR) repeat protein